MNYKLTVKKHSAGQAESHSFFFDEMGWAVALIDEGTGTFAIHSDFGDWAYSWPARNRGQGTIREFICRGGYEYMAEKFCQGMKEEFDHAATTALIRKNISEISDVIASGFVGEYENTEGLPDSSDIENMLEWLDYDEGRDSLIGAEMFYERMPESMKRMMGDPGEFMQFKKPNKYYWLRDGILPAIVEELRKSQTAAAV